VTSRESEWLEAVKRGDDEAFSRLVDTYQKPVYNLCYRMLGNINSAEDAAQETFLGVYKSTSRYELGNRIVKMINQDWAPAINAGLGTIILVFVALGFDEVVPCIGLIPKTIIGIWGLGAVLITRCGTQETTENPGINHQNEIQKNSREVEITDYISGNKGKS